MLTQQLQNLNASTKSNSFVHIDPLSVAEQGYCKS